MSSSLSVYLLDVAATRALIGSRDDQLLETIVTTYGDELAHDDYFRDSIDFGAPTASEALRAVIQGGPFSDDQEVAFQYGYAYKRLCSLTGSFLDNSSFTPHRGDWLSTVDQGLRAFGITAVSVEDFSYGSLPAPLPAASTPGYGEWTPDQITRALAQFEAAKQANDASGQAPPLDADVLEAVTDCLAWMRHAATTPGLGIIGFRS